MKGCILAPCLLLVSMLGQAALTQQQFDQKLDEYTEIVNQSKKVLDGEQKNTDAEVQKKAFCSRLDAYENILRLSKENHQLENAYLMGVIAERYLSRQKQSMNSSGMTERFFCGPNRTLPKL